MADWSIEEQVISTADFPPITAINMKVDASNTAVMVMELHAASGSDPQGAILRFNRNGALISSELVPGVAAASKAAEKPKK